MPLVLASMPTRSAQPRRTNGSPPVMRTLLMPQRRGDSRERRKLLKAEDLLVPPRRDALGGMQ